ncbi:hypothetical protein AAY473_019188 [Plecturocebus cupreus]
MLLVLLSVVLLALSSAQSTDNDVIHEDFPSTTPDVEDSSHREYHHYSHGTDQEDLPRTSHSGNLEFNAEHKKTTSFRKP